MINSLHIAKTGMQAQQTQLDVIAHNLANVATAGFKRGTALFEDLIYQNLRQVGGNTADNAELPTGLQIGLGVRTVATARTYSQGNLQQTDNNLDVAINGNGFFRVQLPDGTIAYTRDGSFKLNNQGQIVTNQGYLLVDTPTVPANARSLTIGKDGQVTVLVPGQTAPQLIGQITLANFINPAGLEPLGQNLFLESQASGAPNEGTPGAEGFGQTLQGFLESSNVNVVQELVNMIQTQRAYELNSKAVTTSDQMLQRLTQL
ncbi:MAG: flagellar basal-body rod protein FlgG [Tepidimonas sp.]|uniref:flagellar basal-body rod protein FlgG n=1 Tax=Tepidimonas sp. TaxID=2002775 RepID=UPI00298F025B|nr:flagellar basal-body rod protein FlgG [Tepidimonas sp.]MCS6810383.1 flagellar basal-body rod protein FlgG [Tepidimonas sp.]MCX7742818.1 flagellar basal-body rod protein FlgG [Tepidimonas sp.]MDW8337375.1 flagellar basal-body rod protein FlgG [Tepidimonas sp.]